MDARKKKDILIIVMVFALCFMAVSYAMLSQELEISGTVSTKGWSVEITDIKVVNTSGEAVNESTDFNLTTASFATTLHQPGDSITYAITVENKGVLDARLESIEIPETVKDDNNNILYNYDGIASNNVLLAGDSITFNITIQCNPEASTITNTSANLTTILKYVQNV